MTGFLSFRQGTKLHARYLKPERRRLILLAVLLFASIGLQLGAPQAVRSFIDATQRGGPPGTLTIAALLFLGASLAQRALALAALYVSQTVGWNATNSLRSDLVRHCLRLPMPFHNGHTPGQLLERIEGDATALANVFSQFAIRIVGNALLVAGILIMLFLEDWRAGLGLAIYAALTFVALGLLQRVAVRHWEASRQAYTDHFGFVEERITAAEDIRANGAEPYVMRRLYGLLRNLLVTDRRALLTSNLSYVSTNFLFVLGYAIGLGLGAYLYTQGAVTLGAAYLIVFYIGMLAQPLDDIRHQAQDFQRASASIGRLADVFRVEPEAEGRGATMLPAGALQLEFDDVQFAYDSAVPVLRGVSFRLEPGQVLGLLGRTGSGKTTLTRLLFRLYDPQSGSIRLHGVDIRDVSLSDLRQHVAMVTQDVQLFAATVRDNLAFFDRDLDDARIEAALVELGLSDWIAALPAGLDTRLGAGGHGLSAGEAQLLAFARVFLKDPGLLVLDEASSRLDPSTQRLLERAVDRLTERRTAIVIAHRLETVFRADMIMIVEDGCIVEYGPRQQLAEDPGSTFRRLLQAGLEETLV